MVGGVGESVGALLGATVSWHVLGDLGAPQPATHTYCGAHWHSQSPFTMAQMPPGFVSQLCWSPLQVTKVGAAVGVELGALLGTLVGARVKLQHTA